MAAEPVTVKAGRATDHAVSLYHAEEFARWFDQFGPLLVDGAPREVAAAVWDAAIEAAWSVADE